MKKLKTFYSEEVATTSVEYAIMLALIIAVCFVGIEAVGGTNGNMMTSNSDQITTAINP